MKKLFYTLIILGCLSFSINAQVGINESNPNKYAALEINGQGTKGIVIPVVNSAKRHELLEDSNSLPQGLLVFDSNYNMFFFWNKKEWIALNPLQAPDNDETTLKLSNNGSVVVFSNSLIVSGATNFQKSVSINDKLTVNGNIDVGKNTINAETVTATTGNISKIVSTTGNINAVTSTTGNITTLTSNTGNITTLTSNTGNITTVNATTVNATTGNGIIPIGGIIMWSGTESNVPNGWSLCDGRNENGRTTPDLRGRFIVGSGQYTSSDQRETVKPNYRIGDKGGINHYVLKIEEMPRHQHNYRYYDDYLSSNVEKNAAVTRTNVYYSLNTTEFAGGNANGTTNSHENRPPYYVLAFIMRTK